MYNMQKKWIVLFLLTALIIPACSGGNAIKSVKTVYIKEYDEYIPYYLLSENYGGKYLFLRVENLPDKMCYCKENTYGSISGYYAESDLDAYLNEDFGKRFSDDFLAMVCETAIEIISKDAVWEGKIPAQTEKIIRQFFVLSAAEMGVKSAMRAKEGISLPAVKSITETEAYWLRSAYLADDITAWVYGNGHYGGEKTVSLQYVRPAFTLEKTVVFETKNINGENVLVISEK